MTIAGRDIPDPAWPAADKIDTSRANAARRYNYWLGGKENFAADRISGDLIANAYPTVKISAVENWRFVHRIVPHLVLKYDVGQIIDVGTGFPVSPNVVELAQSVDPRARIVCIDSDPMVMAHNRALIVGTHQGSVAHIEADIRDPDAILNNSAMTKTLDLTKPVLLVVAAVLHFLSETDNPYGCLVKLVDGLPSGSYIVLTHAGETFMTNNFDDADSYHGGFQARNRSQVAKFFDGLDMVDPGLVSVVDWLPDDEPQPLVAARDAAVYAGVARKP